MGDEEHRYLLRLVEGIAAAQKEGEARLIEKISETEQRITHAVDALRQKLESLETDHTGLRETVAVQAEKIKVLEDAKATHKTEIDAAHSKIRGINLTLAKWSVGVGAVSIAAGAIVAEVVQHFAKAGK